MAMKSGQGWIGRGNAAGWRRPAAKRRCGRPVSPIDWWQPTAPGGRTALPADTTRRALACGDWSRTHDPSPPQGSAANWSMSDA